jgi:exodeoxyribonuclease V alpha subunit
MMLQRNLLYTGMTRAKKLLVIIGSKKALAMAVNNARTETRFSMLLDRLKRQTEMHKMSQLKNSKAIMEGG